MEPIPRGYPAVTVVKIRGVKCYVGVQLCTGVGDPTPTVFKGQLYLNLFEIILYNICAYCPSLSSIR